MTARRAMVAAGLVLALVIAGAYLLTRPSDEADASPSGSSSTSASMDAGSTITGIPVLQVATHETNDILTDVTFFMGYANGAVVFSEKLPVDALEGSAWFGPGGDRFIGVHSDGSTSTISILDVREAQPRDVYMEPSPIPAATIDRAGTSVYFIRTDAAGADAGVWRVPTSGGDAVNVLPPDPDRPFNLNQRGTAFRWTPDGRLLVVQHCRGDRGDDCTWSLVSAESGQLAGRIQPSRPAGLIVGLANDRLLAGLGCDGISCTSSLVDFATAQVTVADAHGARETLIESEAGPVLLRDNGLGNDSYRVTATNLRSGESSVVFKAETGDRSLVTGERGAGGVEIPPGWFAVAAEGQLSSIHLARPLLISIADGRTVELPTLGR